MKEAGDSVGKEFSKKMEASFVLLDPFVSLFFAFPERVPVRQIAGQLARPSFAREHRQIEVEFCVHIFSKIIYILCPSLSSRAGTKGHLAIQNDKLAILKAS